METIELVNDGSGLGFGIIGGKATGVIVKTILPGGVADQVSYCCRSVSLLLTQRCGFIIEVSCLIKGKFDQLTIFHFVGLAFKYSLTLGREYLENRHGPYLKCSCGQCTEHPEEPQTKPA